MIQLRRSLLSYIRFSDRSLSKWWPKIPVMTQASKRASARCCWVVKAPALVLGAGPRKERALRMLSGFNTNYRYRGVLFHVQTEDSGVENPHVITHLFHGGNILASQKLDYSESLQAGSDLESVVRGLMETQHKAMLRGLRDGIRDGVILERLGSGALDAESDDTNSATQSDPMPAPPARAQGAQRAPAAPPARSSRGFGERVVSEKPLDEVVLEYLVENARKRKSRGK